MPALHGCRQFPDSWVFTNRKKKTPVLYNRLSSKLDIQEAKEKLLYSLCRVN